MTVTLSPVAVAVPTFSVAEQLLSALAVWLAGQLMVTVPEFAAVTFTVKLQLSPVATLPVTIVIPTAKKQSLQWLTTTGPHVASLAVGGEKWTIAPS
jgi:hypothetical protein